MFSETDNSLSFYRKDKIPNVGETFGGKVVTEVYRDIDKVRAEESADLLTGGSNYGTPWNSRQTKIEKVFVKDSVAPISTAYWFFMQSLSEINISKLDTRLTDNMFAMFAGINTQTIKDNVFLDVSNLNTNNVKDMGFMFAQCFAKKIIGLQNFDTSKVTNMNAMFNYGIQRHLDLSSFTITENTNTDMMLYDQLNLETLKTGSKVKFSGKEGLDGDWKDSQDNIFQIANFPVNKEETYTRASNFQEEIGGTAKIKIALVGKDVVYEFKIDSSNKYPDIYFSYEWYVDGQLISEEKSYTPKPEEAGKKIKLKVNVLGSKAVVSNEVDITTGEELVNFAVYSEDDNSLDFYRRKAKEVPNVGGVFEGKATSKVYTELTNGSSYYTDLPWFIDKTYTKVVSVNFVDKMQLDRTDYMFYLMENLAKVNLKNLDTNKTTNMSNMFCYCTSENLDINVNDLDFSSAVNVRDIFSNTKISGDIDLTN